MIVPSQLRVHQDIQDALGRLIVVPVRFDRFSSGFGQFVDGDDDVLPGSNLHTSSSLRCGLPNTSSRGGARRRPLRRRRQRRREERRFRGGGGSKTHLLFSSSSVCARVVWRVVLLRVPVSQLIGNIQKKAELVLLCTRLVHVTFSTCARTLFTGTTI